MEPTPTAQRHNKGKKFVMRRLYTQPTADLQALSTTFATDKRRWEPANENKQTETSARQEAIGTRQELVRTSTGAERNRSHEKARSGWEWVQMDAADGNRRT